MVSRSVARALTCLVLAALLPACGGGGSGVSTPAQIVLLSDDFQGGSLSNWALDWTSSISTYYGNPPTSIYAGGATTAQAFDFSSGLTVQFDLYTPSPLPTGTLLWGGINSGTSIIPGLGAGIGVGLSSTKWQCYLNGAVVHTSFYGPGQAYWSTLSVKILRDGTVQYYIDNYMIHHSSGTVSFTSPRTALLGIPSGWIYADNIVVTVP